MKISKTYRNALAPMFATVDQGEALIVLTASGWWGRGATVEELEKNMGGTVRAPFVVYRGSDQCTVNDMGQIVRPADSAPPAYLAKFVWR